MGHPIPPEGRELLDRFTADVQELILRVRDRVLEVIPDAHEIVMDAGYTVSLHFGPDDRPRDAVLYIAGFSKHVNLGFFAGAVLDDPVHVLAGTGGRMRHAKFVTPDQVERADWLESYIGAAVTAAGFDGSMGDGTTTVRPRRGKAGVTFVECRPPVNVLSVSGASLRSHAART